MFITRNIPEGKSTRQSKLWGSLKRYMQKRTAVCQCGAVMTCATNQGRAPHSARHFSRTPNVPLDDIVVTTAKTLEEGTTTSIFLPTYMAKPTDLRIKLQCPTAALGVPDTH